MPQPAVDLVPTGAGLVPQPFFSALNIVDDFTRECVAIEVDRSLPGARVVLVLERRRALDGARRLPPRRPDGLKNEDELTLRA